jgi:hypothetical protein
MQKVILKKYASQYYPLDPSTAALVLDISNLLFWAGIIIIVVAIGWIVRDWYIDRKTPEEALGLGIERNDEE